MITAANHMARPPEPKRYLTVSQWIEYFDWPSEGGLRWIIFNAKTNGFAPAIKRVGRRVLIDVTEFWSVVGRQGG